MLPLRCMLARRAVESPLVASPKSRTKAALGSCSIGSGAVGLAHFEYRNDVGVVQLTGRAGLAHKTIPIILAAADRGRQHLQSHATTHGLVPRFVDNTHAATSDLTHDRVFAQFLRHGESVRLVRGLAVQ